ncbi:hypothetical protein [Halomonas sp. HL-93]|uniref:hypothetical protein n=1 Tax=Halomonas sp. HL-93 TaxID=1666906 RepID=UPI0007F14907|nr:hypothetical protein [Halomonas sp. HL-93]SBR51588.1 hypothetical protein GA0071314_3267 [Halomonas sp. HL-93]
MNDLTALTFLPQEQILLTHSHETIELNRYRWLALTFLPFDSSVSGLMNAIGLECVHRLCSLQEVAQKMELGACVSNLDKLVERPLINNNSQHFFIIDKSMGHQVLIMAEEAAKVSCDFFGWLLETNAIPELHNIFFAFVAQKEKEYRILQECRLQWGVGVSDLSIAV